MDKCSKNQIRNEIIQQMSKEYPRCKKIIHSDLSRHIRQVHAINNYYSCSFCLKHFSQRRHLVTHIEREHPLVMAKNSDIEVLFETRKVQTEIMSNENVNTSNHEKDKLAGRENGVEIKRSKQTLQKRKATEENPNGEIKRREIIFNVKELNVLYNIECKMYHILMYQLMLYDTTVINTMFYALPMLSYNIVSITYVSYKS